MRASEEARARGALIGRARRIASGEYIIANGVKLRGRPEEEKAAAKAAAAAKRRRREAARTRRRPKLAKTKRKGD